MMKRTIIVLALLAMFSWRGIALPETAVQKLDPDVQVADRVYRATPNGEGALTEQMIEVCIVLKGNVESGYAWVTSAKKELDKLDSGIKKLQKYLEKSKDNFNSKDSKALAVFKKEYESYNAKLAELNKKLADYDRENATYHENVSRYDAVCKGQALYEDDYKRVVERVGHGM